jgi:methylmalonyl-CoA mutase cobalamin-binding subunit
MVIPPAANRFPFLAEAGFDNIFKPRIKVMEPIR